MCLLFLILLEGRIYFQVLSKEDGVYSKKSFSTFTGDSVDYSNPSADSKPSFVVGICDRLSRRLTQALTEAAFYDFNVTMLKLPKDGAWWPDHEMPDAIFCMGWFYNRSIHNLRIASPKNDSHRSGWDGLIHWDKTSRPLQNRPFTMALNSEPWGRGTCESYDVILDIKKTKLHSGCHTIIHSYGFNSMYSRKPDGPEVIPILHKRNITEIMLRKEYLVGFISSKCDYGSYPIEASLRVSLFDTLVETYGNSTVHAIGNCRKNPNLAPATIDGIPPNEWFNYPPQFYKAYKFAITFENSHLPGYTTEKLFSGLLGDTVPIYFGNPDIKDLVNPARFIHCPFNVSNLVGYKGKPGDLRNAWVKEKSQKELQMCVDKIEEVASNDTLYKQMLMEPVYPNYPKPSPLLDIQEYGKAIRMVYDATKAVSI